MSEFISIKVGPEKAYSFWKLAASRVEIESFCRQVLALCDAEFHEERQRLQMEQTAIIERRKCEAAMERGIDEAPGVIVHENYTLCPHGVLLYRCHQCL